MVCGKIADLLRLGNKAGCADIPQHGRKLIIALTVRTKARMPTIPARTETTGDRTPAPWPVPAAPLEQVIADRLIQLSRQDRTVDRLVKDAMADTSELLGNLADRRTTLCASRKRVQDQIDALVEGIANRRTALKSVSEKIVELEEQLEDEILEVGMEIETAKQKAVSAQSLTESLTTFGDLYREALPEERRELIRLRVNHSSGLPMRSGLPCSTSLRRVRS